jgi:hypothetical protein
MTARWKADEEDRLARVAAGATVTANLKRDHRLLAWAQEEGRYVLINRDTEWGNPYHIGRDGDRATVIDKYRAYLNRSPKLLARLPELRGKVLVCHCFPARCHGDVLIERLEAIDRRADDDE